MAIQRTFSIIKPDATRRNLTGKVVARLEEAGLRVVAQRRILMSRAQAEGFYSVHRERPRGLHQRRRSAEKSMRH